MNLLRNGLKGKEGVRSSRDLASTAEYDFKLYLSPLEPFGWNYKPAGKHCWLIFCERKILFRLKKQAE
jgi:hypothetical protein